MKYAIVRGGGLRIPHYAFISYTLSNERIITKYTGSNIRVLKAAIANAEAPFKYELGGSLIFRRNINCDTVIGTNVIDREHFRVVHLLIAEKWTPLACAHVINTLSIY